MAKHGIHIVGSVPLANAAQVFETLSAALGAGLRSLPDGETGPRIDWLPWMEPIFSENPAFEQTSETFAVHNRARVQQRYKLKAGVTATDVKFTNMPHSGFAMESWPVFAHLKKEGKIPPKVRYQYDFASLPSVIQRFVVQAEQDAIAPLFEAALMGELEKICAAIPHDQLAIQWDVASSIFYYLETGEATRYGKTREEMLKTFVDMHVRFGNRVPKDVELMYHLCYGDANHRHSVEPTDMRYLVDFANGVSAAIGRSIEVIHAPVPRNRTDDAYFAPLARLKLRPETSFALGLVHHTDGVEGTRARMTAADKYLKDYMIGTECGFGRRDPATLPKLMEIHAQAAGLR